MFVFPLPNLSNRFTDKIWMNQCKRAESVYIPHKAIAHIGKVASLTSTESSDKAGQLNKTFQLLPMSVSFSYTGLNPVHATALEGDGGKE